MKSDLTKQIQDVIAALGSAEGHAEKLLIAELRRLQESVNRRMQVTTNEEEFDSLFALREQAGWQIRTGGDPEWQAEQRFEAMMLGEWDYNTQTPSW